MIKKIKDGEWEEMQKRLCNHMFELKSLSEENYFTCSNCNERIYFLNRQQIEALKNEKNNQETTGKSSLL